MVRWALTENRPLTGRMISPCLTGPGLGLQGFYRRDRGRTLAVALTSIRPLARPAHSPLGSCRGWVGLLVRTLCLLTLLSLSRVREGGGAGFAAGGTVGSGPWAWCTPCFPPGEWVAPLHLNVIGGTV